MCSSIFTFQVKKFREKYLETEDTERTPEQRQDCSPRAVVSGFWLAGKILMDWDRRALKHPFALQVAAGCSLPCRMQMVAWKSKFSDCQLWGGAQRIAIRMPAFVVIVVCLILPFQMQMREYFKNGALKWFAFRRKPREFWGTKCWLNRAPVEGVKLQNWSDFAYCKMDVSKI